MNHPVVSYILQIYHVLYHVAFRSFVLGKASFVRQFESNFRLKRLMSCNVISACNAIIHVMTKPNNLV